MKIDIEAYRKLDRLISELDQDLATELLGTIGLKEGTKPNQRVEQLVDFRDNDWNLADYKVLWGAAELANFFTSWVQPFKTEPASYSLRKIRSKIKHEKLKNDNLIALEMSYDPQVYFLARTPDTYRALLDKTLTTEDIRDSVYWIPELGILLSKIHDDENGRLFRKILEEQLIGEFKEFRIKSLIVSELFNTDRHINELIVSADPQISGFDGLDQIAFTGPDVKMGLAGLYRRHDIRVNIHQIGPNVAVENHHLRLHIGPKIKVKSIEGIVELHMLLYPEYYPTTDQLGEIVEQFNEISKKEDEIMQLKRDNFEDLTVVEEDIADINKQIEKMKRIPLAELAKRWGLDQFRVEYRLSKAMENGMIKAKFIEDAIVKR